MNDYRFAQDKEHGVKKPVFTNVAPWHIRSASIMHDKDETGRNQPGKALFSCWLEEHDTSSTDVGCFTGLRQDG